jgi:hypothetical protein
MHAYESLGCGLDHKFVEFIQAVFLPPNKVFELRCFEYVSEMSIMYQWNTVHISSKRNSGISVGCRFHANLKEIHPL